MKMSICGTTATILVTLLFGMAARADDAGVPNDRFAVTLPAGYTAFTKQVQTSKSPEGVIETTTWISRAPTGEAVVVTMSDMPAAILDPQKLITSTRTSLLKSLGPRKRGPGSCIPRAFSSGAMQRSFGRDSPSLTIASINSCTSVAPRISELHRP